MEYVLDSLTLVVSLIVLTFNIAFSRRENTRKFLIDNVIRQRNADMLEMRKETARFATLSDKNIVALRSKDENYLQETMLCSKAINHLLKRKYKEDKQVLAIKDKLMTSIMEYHSSGDKNLLDNIGMLNGVFGRISELYVFCAWQCIKIQGTGEKRLESVDFGKLFNDYKNSYLNNEDIKLIDSVDV